MELWWTFFWKNIALECNFCYELFDVEWSLGLFGNKVDFLVIRLWTFGSVMDFLLEKYCMGMQLVLWTFRSWMDFSAFQKQSEFNSNSVITCWMNWCYKILQIHWIFGLFGNQFDFISLGVMKLFSTFSTWYKTSNLLSSVQIAFIRKLLCVQHF